MRCPECFSEGKLRVPGKDVIKEVEMVDPDFGNEMNFISLKNAPVCMTMRGPSQHSVWYDQTGIVLFLFIKQLTQSCAPLFTLHVLYRRTLFSCV